jgi:hypothetical protein
MQIEDVPQDKSALENFTRELCYAKSNEGKYKTELSSGWDIKKYALDNTWGEINEAIETARNAVILNKRSPLFYFMELRLMNVSILSDYTGFWKFTIKRHLKPNVFKRMSQKKLSIYANALDITVDELKYFKG